MELPDVGEQCSLETCKQLDFLPFTCGNCRKIFCKQHYITSAHDCTHLNEFFKKPEKVRFERYHILDSSIGYTLTNTSYDLQTEIGELFLCNDKDCKTRSPLQLLCSSCNLHYCVIHRHHGCRDDLPKGERKKLQVEQWKKPKEQFKIAKAQIDSKVIYYFA